MEVELRAGAKIDLLSQKELDHSLGRAHEAEVRELARGVKFVRQTATPKINQPVVLGPDLGYAWSLKMVSVVLSSSSVFNVYFGDQANIGTAGNIMQNLIGRSSVAGTLHAIFWSSSQMVLFGGENLTLDAETSSSLINSYLITAHQVPAEMIWKIL